MRYMVDVEVSTRDAGTRVWSELSGSFDLRDSDAVEGLRLMMLVIGLADAADDLDSVVASIEPGDNVTIAYVDRPDFHGEVSLSAE